MSTPIVVIGGGVNGLVCATLLARAGRQVTLVEQRDAVGGAAVTRELTPGFRVPALAHSVGPLRADVARDLGLGARGLEFVASDAWITALDGHGRALTLWHDPAKAAAAIARLLDPRRRALAGVHGSPQRPRPGRRVGLRRDAAVGRRADRTGTVGAAAHGATVPRRSAATTATGCCAGGRWRWPIWSPSTPTRRCCGRRWRPTASSAACSGRGRRAAACCSCSTPPTTSPATPRSVWPRGGPGAAGRGPAPGGRGRRRVDCRRRESRGGGHRRRSDARCAARRRPGDGGATGRVGHRSEGAPSRSAIRWRCRSELRWRASHYRAKGTLAKVNLALSSLPVVPGADREQLTGRLRMAPDVDFIERAFDHVKYGRFSPAPWLEATIPSLVDRVAGAAGRARGVDLRAVRAGRRCATARGKPRAGRCSTPCSTPSIATCPACAA